MFSTAGARPKLEGLALEVCISPTRVRSKPELARPAAHPVGDPPEVSWAAAGYDDGEVVHGLSVALIKPRDATGIDAVHDEQDGDPEDDFGEAVGDDWPQPGWAGRVRESSRDRSCAGANHRISAGGLGSCFTRSLRTRFKVDWRLRVAGSRNSRSVGVETERSQICGRVGHTDHGIGPCVLLAIERDWFGNVEPTRSSILRNY